MRVDLGILILRVSIGLVMLLAHGLPKLMNFSVMSTKFPDPLGVGSSFSLVLAIFSEVVCSIALIVGFKTRWATIPLAITMLVAMLIVHGNDPWKTKEFAFLYLIPYVSFFFLGSGNYSVDHVMSNKKA